MGVQQGEQWAGYSIHLSGITPSPTSTQLPSEEAIRDGDLDVPLRA